MILPARQSTFNLWVLVRTKLIEDCRGEFTSGGFDRARSMFVSSDRTVLSRWHTTAHAAVMFDVIAGVASDLTGRDI